ncbi:Scr1 family TA system antitoxin-like transcriptional regulator [Streptomyces sp. NPDC001978]|uniref:Scr1 family TA system antitoxin-like transcriptional regulator n=1 Tax=Streptomyces sp. NPDC001978 TaxID=3364627 RepID=UPI0036C68430
MSERDHITILVIPFDAGTLPGSGQSFYYSTGPVPQLDTVHLVQSHGPGFLDAEAQLDKYRVILERMKAGALPPVESRDFIRKIAHDL